MSQAHDKKLSQLINSALSRELILTKVGADIWLELRPEGRGGDYYPHICRENRDKWVGLCKYGFDCRGIHI